MQERIYLDYAASTPTDPRAREAMATVAGLAGNPSSTHAEGRELRMAIDKARAQVAGLLGAAEEEIVFTSGATEANGAAIRGVLAAIRKAHSGRSLRIAVSGIEHASVMESVRAAETDGEAVVDVIAADKQGIVTAAAATEAIGPDTAVVAVMWVNNVLGTLQPVAAIGAAVLAERAKRGPQGLPIIFVCDAVQAARTEDLREAATADIITLSSHKIYGPKGVGALRVRRGTPFQPLAGGGGQESGRRHGTENVEGIVGFGAAASLVIEGCPAERARMQRVQDTFVADLATKIPEAKIVGGATIPGIVFVRFPDMRGDELALRLDAAGIAVSAGSACDAGTRKSPRVLGQVLDEQSALRGGIRVSFGRLTGEDDMKKLVDALTQIRKTAR